MVKDKYCKLAADDGEEGLVILGKKLRTKDPFPCHLKFIESST